MAARFLAVDLGNSRCKLGVFEGTTLVDAASLPVEAELPDALAAWLRSRPPAARAALCSVAAPALEQRVAAALREAVAGPVDVAPDPALELAVRSPETVGRDRLFSARGALAVVGGSAIVVDAGTALTVDAVRGGPPGGVLVGTFLGGAIAPGPELLARALALGGARLPSVEPRPGAAALGRDTTEALLAGIAVGVAGAARRLVEGVERESGLAGAPLVLTGGARAYVSEALAEGRPAPRVVEALVLLGLRAAADARPAA